MRGLVFILLGSVALARAGALARADTVECANGDRYNGKVLLVDGQNVKLQNEIAGVLAIPRAKVTSITFGPPPAKAQTAASTVPPPKTNTLASAAAIQKVQQEYLGDASPEANAMFQTMVRDLMSGKMNVEQLRGKAQNTLKELNDLSKDLGDEETTALLNSYAGILESFLKNSPSTPAPSPAPKP